jgi:hypothetical protein
MELVTNGNTMTVIHLPTAYKPRKGLGPRQLAWIKARGWLAGPRVERKENV